MTSARDKSTELFVGAVRIIRAPGGADPAFVIPAVEGRVLGAREFNFELLQRLAGFENQTPHFRGIGSTECFFQF